jgi:hypothetical protein
VGEDPQRLERDIELTRVKLGEDIDALEEKVNPKKVAHRSVDRAKEKVAEAKDKVAGAAAVARDRAVEAKDRVADRMSSGSDSTDPVVAGDTDSGGGLGQKVSGLVGTAREKAVPLAATARDRAAPLAATAQEKAVPLVATAIDRVAPLAVTAREKAAERVGMDPHTAETREVAAAVAGGTWSMLLEQTRRNPVLVGAAAFGLGLVLGHR